jgi:hypothetical protein|tara:strand:+ start:55 stop:174 length:120 start_codon:yes stop_codon:yes gene_type:complete
MSKFLEEKDSKDQWYRAKFSNVIKITKVDVLKRMENIDG